MDQQQHRSITFRPTEAQLRWAQFHHSKNARLVRERIHILQRAGDDEIVERGTNGIEYSAVRMQRLKESEENYWKRYELIQRNGYRIFVEEEEDDGDTESILLAELFHDGPTPKRGRRRQRKQFQAIYRLLLRKLHGTKDIQTILHTDKRWQRSGPSAETFLVDGRHDMDLTPWKAGMLDQVDWNDEDEVASLVQELHRHHPEFCQELLVQTSSSSSTLSSLYHQNDGTTTSWVQRIVRELEHQHGADLFTTVLPDISDTSPQRQTRVRCHKQTLAKLLPFHLFQHEKQGGNNEQDEDEAMEDFKRRLLDNVLHQLEGDQGGGDHLSLESPAELGTILEHYMSKALEVAPEAAAATKQQPQEPSLFGRLRQSMSLSTKVSELFHSLDVETYATFRRRSQERDTETTTSVSSFRVLPAGIRKAVQHHLGKSQDADDNDDPAQPAPQTKDPPELRHESKEDTVSEISIAPECADLTAKYHPKLLQTLTPELIQKRLQQAVTCLQHQAWNAALMLLKANPWLAEMSILPSNQYLLHVAVMGYPPNVLIEELLRLAPNAIYKWDTEGNLPLHYASSGTLAAHLGDRFPSGASVRNEKGMLPLHLAIQSGCVMAVPTLTGYFGSGLAVADNEGNLPIHTAAICQGDRRDVLEMIEFLLKEADRQVEENCLRFRQKVPKTLEDDETMDTNMTKDFEDETSNCLIVRNDMGDTPLSLAIYHKAGWNVIDSLTTHSGGLQGLDEHENTALHLVTSEEYADPAATLAILRKVPEAATIHNEHGVLPIENACMQGFPREVILGLVLVDLPINLDQKKEVELREEAFGESWWYITCDCDDHYVDIVKEVMELCNYEQAKALCFISDGPDVLFRRASPKCKQALANSMRFCGRFEVHDEGQEKGTFNAVDYGSPFDPIPEGQRVLIRSYASKEDYETDVGL